MGFFSRLGNKLADGASNASRLGQKALGTIHRVGNKIASQGSKIVSGVERIPILGQVLSPATGIVRSGIGLVKNVADLAGSGSVEEATNVLRRGKNLVGTSKNTLERAKEVQRDAVKIAQRSM